MGVYSRFKRDANGFRALVELLESTPKVRRDRMIKVGMEEDPEYTERAMRYMLSFRDILELSDMELAEVIAKAPPRMTAIAISPFDEETQQRFFKNAPPSRLGAIRELVEELDPSKTEVGGAQLYLVTVTRDLEKRGLVTAKRIPVG